MENSTQSNSQSPLVDKGETGLEAVDSEEDELEKDDDPEVRKFCRKSNVRVTDNRSSRNYRKRSPDLVYSPRRRRERSPIMSRPYVRQNSQFSPRGRGFSANGRGNHFDQRREGHSPGQYRGERRFNGVPGERKPGLLGTSPGSGNGEPGERKPGLLGTSPGSGNEEPGERKPGLLGTSPGSGNGTLNERRRNGDFSEQYRGSRNGEYGGNSRNNGEPNNVHRFSDGSFRRGWGRGGPKNHWNGNRYWTGDNSHSFSNKNNRGERYHSMSRPTYKSNYYNYNYEGGYESGRSRGSNRGPRTGGHPNYGRGRFSRSRSRSRSWSRSRSRSRRRSRSPFHSHSMSRSRSVSRSKFQNPVSDGESETARQVEPQINITLISTSERIVFDYDHVKTQPQPIPVNEKEDDTFNSQGAFHNVSGIRIDLENTQSEKERVKPVLAAELSHISSKKNESDYESDAETASFDEVEAISNIVNSNKVGLQIVGERLEVGKFTSEVHNNESNTKGAFEPSYTVKRSEKRLSPEVVCLEEEEIIDVENTSVVSCEKLSAKAKSVRQEHLTKSPPDYTNEFSKDPARNKDSSVVIDQPLPHGIANGTEASGKENSVAPEKNGCNNKEKSQENTFPKPLISEVNKHSGEGSSSSSSSSSEAAKDPDYCESDEDGLSESEYEIKKWRRSSKDSNVSRRRRMVINSESDYECKTSKRNQSQSSCESDIDSDDMENNEVVKSLGALDTRYITRRTVKDTVQKIEEQFKELGAVPRPCTSKPLQSEVGQSSEGRRKDSRDKYRVVGSQGFKVRRKRVDKALQTLSQAFKSCSVPTDRKIQSLSYATGFNYEKIKDWFRDKKLEDLFGDKEIEKRGPLRKIPKEPPEKSYAEKPLKQENKSTRVRSKPFRHYGTRIGKKERIILEEFFAETQMPVPLEIDSLCSKTRLVPYVVKKWFINRRAKYAEPKSSSENERTKKPERAQSQNFSKCQKNERRPEREHNQSAELLEIDNGRLKNIWGRLNPVLLDLMTLETEDASSVNMLNDESSRVSNFKWKIMKHFHNEHLRLIQEMNLHLVSANSEVIWDLKDEDLCRNFVEDVLNPWTLMLIISFKNRMELRNTLIKLSNGTESSTHEWKIPVVLKDRKERRSLERRSSTSS